MPPPTDERFVLIVEDQPAIARTLSDLVGALAPVQVSATLAEARPVLESPADLLAAIVDVSLPDGNGIDLIAEIRPRRPLLPVLVLTARDDWEDVNRAFALAARYVRKTRDASFLARMVTSFVLAALPDVERAMSIVDQFCDRYDLSPRQRELVRLYIQGCPRDGLASAMRLAENTVKYHVRETLHKCEASSLDALCRQILQESLRTVEGEPGE